MNVNETFLQSSMKNDNLTTFIMQISLFLLA